MSERNPMAGKSIESIEPEKTDQILSQEEFESGLDAEIGIVARDVVPLFIAGDCSLEELPGAKIKVLDSRTRETVLIVDRMTFLTAWTDCLAYEKDPDTVVMWGQVLLPGIESDDYQVIPVDSLNIKVVRRDTGEVLAFEEKKFYDQMKKLRAFAFKTEEIIESLSRLPKAH